MATGQLAGVAGIQPAGGPIDSVYGRIALVLGGSGFLGVALVRRLIESGAAEVRVLSRAQARPSSGLAEARVFSGDIRDERIVRAAMRGTNLVFHLAAIKSVDVCERQPDQAIATNIRGTAVVVGAALSEPSLERFIAVSSDKASNPVSVYGLTKAFMERMVAEAQVLSGAEFGTVRCGGLWGSEGSVIAVWLDALRAGAELTMTDPAMTRFAMLRQEAVDLLIEATKRPLGGGILASVMPSYALGDLAAVVSRSQDVTIRTTGTRPGEKRHDDLVSPEEGPFTERSGGFFKITLGRRGAGTPPFGSANARRLTRDELAALFEKSKGGS